jgi:hypothetical protein
MQYVQLVLTDVQAGLLAKAAGNARLATEDEVEQGQFGALMDFLYAVEAQPARFPVTMPGMRRAIKKRIARTKGPAQPKPNKRKRAQLRAQGGQKRTRAQKRAEALAYNAEREAQMEAVVKEKAKGLGIILPGRRRKRAE